MRGARTTRRGLRAMMFSASRKCFRARSTMKAQTLPRAGCASTAAGSVDAMPLSYYRSRSLYVMRTDALDRFGTRLEHRFTRKEITGMLESAGLRDIVFSENAPYWCAVGLRS